MITADAPETFNAWYQELYPKIYRYLFGLTGSHPEAEQLAQETFTGLYHMVSSRREVRNPQALAYRIAHNICLNHLKREKKYKDIIGRKAVLSADTALSREESLIEEQKAARAREALARLPERDRTCLLLYLEELSYSEISEALGVKKTSVGKILARAAERLGREIQNGDRP